MSARRLESWIKQPLIDLAQISQSKARDMAAALARAATECSLLLALLVFCCPL